MKIACNKETKRNIIIKQVRHHMLDLNVKNIDISSKIGQTEQSTSNLLNPNYRPDSSISIDQLAMICDAMNCDLILEITPRK